MRGFLSMVVVVFVATFAALSILSGPADRLHLTGLGGTDGTLVSTGDDNGVGH